MEKGINTSEYWQERYINKDTPWDIGYASTPLAAFVDQLTDKSLSILIPGAGKAHEAIHLHQLGFKNVIVCDWAPAAFQYLRENEPSFPLENMLVSDFFDLDLQVDLILEQTFVSAIHPNRRSDFAKKASELLRPKGAMVGLLFGVEFPFEGPPFGGTILDYKQVFENHFNIKILEKARNSIKPREGNELFFHFIKK